MVLRRRLSALLSLPQTKFFTHTPFWAAGHYTSRSQSGLPLLHLQATMREVISVHIGQAGIQVSNVSAFYAATVCGGEAVAEL